MALSQTDIEIEHSSGDLITYKITNFPASKGVKYFKQLMKIVGPSIASLAADEATADLEEGMVDASSLETAVQLLVENMDKGDIEALIKNLVSEVVYVDPNLSERMEVSKTFDMHFSGEYGALFSLLMAVVKENYSSLFQSGFGLNLGT